MKACRPEGRAQSVAVSTAGDDVRKPQTWISCRRQPCRRAALVLGVEGHIEASLFANHPSPFSHALTSPLYKLSITDDVGAGS
jgi:hypothetical protein